MKAHRSRLDRHLEVLGELQRQQPINESEYEEWRTHPCTRRLFDELEFNFLTNLENHIHNSTENPEKCFAAANRLAGAENVIDHIFEWSPSGIELEDDYEA